VLLTVFPEEIGLCVSKLSWEDQIDRENQRRGKLILALPSGFGPVSPAAPLEQQTPDPLT
jgi:hypothetical protein